MRIRKWILRNLFVGVHTILYCTTKKIHVFNNEYNSFSLSCPDFPATALVSRIMSGIERTGDDSWNFIQSCRIWTDCKKTLHIYFFSELVSGRNPPNLTIWLVPRAGGILRSCPLTRLSMSKNRHFHDDTRDALCPPPEEANCRCELWATVNYVTSKSPVIRIPGKKALMEKV